MTEIEPQFLEVVSTSALELRSALTPLQAGVVGATDLKVSAGAGLTIDVASGIAFVRGTNVTDQGLYRVRNDATKNSAAFDVSGVPANSSGQPRIDQVIARVLDHTHDNSGLRRWRLEYVAGTGTAGATLDNRNGAVSDVGLGNNWLRSADVLIPTGAASVLAANIRDRRPWARGAYFIIKRTANAAAGTDYTTTSLTLVVLDATNVSPRIECSGVPVRAKLMGRAWNSVGGITGGIELQMRLDGSQWDDQTAWHMSVAGGADVGGAVLGETDAAPAAGSHVIAPYFRAVAGGTASVRAVAGGAAIFTVEELVRQNASNT